MNVFIDVTKHYPLSKVEGYCVPKTISLTGDEAPSIESIRDYIAAKAKNYKLESFDFGVKVEVLEKKRGDDPYELYDYYLNRCFGDNGVVTEKVLITHEPIYSTQKFDEHEVITPMSWRSLRIAAAQEVKGVRVPRAYGLGCSVERLLDMACKNNFDGKFVVTVVGYIADLTSSNYTHVMLIKEKGYDLIEISEL